MANNATSVEPGSLDQRRPSRDKTEYELNHVDKAEMGSIDNPKLQEETQLEPEYDAAEAKKIIRKVDWRLIPLLMFLYTLTFLDRVNIGNARLWNLEKDLGMTGYDYNIVVLGE